MIQDFRKNFPSKLDGAQAPGINRSDDIRRWFSKYYLIGKDMKIFSNACTKHEFKHRQLKYIYDHHQDDVEGFMVWNEFCWRVSTTERHLSLPPDHPERQIPSMPLHDGEIDPGQGELLQQ